MSEILRWADPPPAQNLRGRPSIRPVFVEQLKTRPGRWAQYRPDRSFSRQSGSIMKVDFPGVEIANRRREDGRFDIYARWVGDEVV